MSGSPAPYKAAIKLSDFDSLIEQKLVRVKNYPEQSLCVIKYQGKVFYDNLWGQDKMLNEARGIVFDTTTGEVVIWPFTKVFNHHENGTKLDPETMVIAPRKVNGFMASVSSHNGEMLIATTGTLDSDYVGYAREYLEHTTIKSIVQNLTTNVNTLLFEICHPSDPHIVDEAHGAYLIGGRNHETGLMFTEQHLDAIAKDTAMKRPEWFRMKFGDLVKLSRTVDHEGFMVRLLTGETVMKIKTPHYLTKKFLMRMGSKKVVMMYEDPHLFKQSVDEEYYDLVDYLVSEVEYDDFAHMRDQERKDVIEKFWRERDAKAYAISGPGVTGQREVYTGCDSGNCLACTTL
jgi:hypothetical protein